jgi:hypothetical protein
MKQGFNVKRQLVLNSASLKAVTVDSKWALACSYFLGESSQLKITKYKVELGK